MKSDLDNVIVARPRPAYIHVLDYSWPLREDGVHVYLILQIEIRLHSVSRILGQMATVAPL